MLAAITYQDFKERQVTALLFLVAAVVMGILHFKQVSEILFLYNSFINLAFTIAIIAILFLYSKFKLKMSFLKEAFGLGDILFFIAFAFAFPTYTFIVLFVFSLFFSLIISVVLRKKITKNSIPLAGLMALFLIVIYSFSWITNGYNLYLL